MNVLAVRAAILATSTLVVALFLSLSSSFVAADVDTPGAKTSRGHIARNTVSGNAINVCGDDYPASTRAAVEVLNKGLRDQGFVNFDVFAFAEGCATPDPDTPDYVGIDYVQIIEGDPTNKRSRFVCNRQNPPNGCIYVGKSRQSGPPWYSYMLDLTVSMNEKKRDSAYDRLGSGDDSKTNQIRRTLTHELAHALGLRDEYTPMDKEYDLGEIANTPGGSVAHRTKNCTVDDSGGDSWDDGEEVLISEETLPGCANFLWSAAKAASGPGSVRAMSSRPATRGRCRCVSPTRRMTGLA